MVVNRLRIDSFIYDNTGKGSSAWRTEPTSDNRTDIITNGILSIGIQTNEYVDNLGELVDDVYTEKNISENGGYFGRVDLPEKLSLKFSGKTCKPYLRKKTEADNHSYMIGFINLDLSNRVFVSADTKYTKVLEYSRPVNRWNSNEVLSMIISYRSLIGNISIKLYNKITNKIETYVISPLTIDKGETPLIDNEQYASLPDGTYVGYFKKFRPGKPCKLIIYDKEDKDSLFNTIPYGTKNTGISFVFISHFSPPYSQGP